MKKTGVLIINTGSPTSPKPWHVATYLYRFLTDKRVITIPSVFRYILVCLIIIPLRLLKVSKRYKLIHNKDFPLNIETNRLAIELNKSLGEKYCVKYAMRYNKPSISKAVQTFCNGDYSNLIVLPMFPHYTSAMTGSALEAVYSTLKNETLQPNINIISNFYDKDFFIDSVVENSKNINISNYQHIIFVYHSMPLSQLVGLNDKSEIFRYDNAVTKTSELVANRLDIKKYSICYQSAIGKKWLKPDIEETVLKLKNEGVKDILCFSLSFVTGCLENVFELDMYYKSKFHKLGLNFDTVKSLDSSTPWFSNISDTIKSFPQA